tara:strand:- start:1144 stop:2658 length:1515 start_codon:yes stop_codon:yes gene_type:complete
MKSFNNFISETSSGSKGGGNTSFEDPWVDPKKKNKGISDQEVNKRLSASTTKGDQARRQYNTSGIQGDSNTGVGAGEVKSNKKSNKKPTNKPLSPKSKRKLIKTNKQTGGKVTVNTSEITGTGKLNKPDVQADKLRDSISKSPELARLTADKGKENLLNAINSKKLKSSSIPNPRKGELGKLYKTGTITDPMRAGSVRTTDRINAELTAKRKARINPTTGKATPKGVENFAINQQTKGFSAKGASGKKAIENAKKIASNTTSKAYKDIETKINTSDYAGKRAKVASTKELDKIARDLKTSKTLGAQVDTGRGSIAPTKIKTVSPSKFSLNTSTRKGKVTPLTKTSGIKYKDFAKKATGAKSNLSKLKITPKNLAGKALGPAIAAWNFKDNYTSTKGSALRKFTKAALKTGAYYAGASGGAAVGTAGGSFTGPGAFVTGAIGAITGGETASNLADKAFNKIWKPPTTKTKTKEKDKKVAVPPTGGGKNDGYTWKTGISIGPSSKK